MALDMDDRALFRAIEANDVAAMEEAIKNGADINARRKDGSSVIMYAAHEGRAECLRWLIDRGADVNAMDNCGRTALMGVVRYGYSNDCLDILVGAGADVNIADHYGVTATMIVATDGRFAGVTGGAEWLRVFIKAGADINAVDCRGYTAARQAAYNRNVDCLLFLIESGADLEKTDVDGESALDIIRKNGFSEALLVWERKSLSQKVRQHNLRNDSGIGL